MAKEIYIVAKVHLLNKNVLQNKVEYLFNPVAEKEKPIFESNASEENFGSYSLLDEENALKHFDALVGVGAPMVNDNGADISPVALMTSLNIFEERVSLCIELTLVSIEAKQDVENEAITHVMKNRHIYAGFVVR